MNSVTRLPLRIAPRLVQRPSFVRPIHSTVVKAANVAPVVGTGPPPEPPVQAQDVHQRVARRRRQAEMLKNAKELRSSSGGKAGGALKKRFWKDVTVQEVDGK
jgi:ATP synthase F1 complex assembly factor 2